MALVPAVDPDRQLDFRLPRIRHIPTQGRRNAELGRTALYLCGDAGLVLDEWEAYVLQHSLRCRADGKWGALEVGVCVPRQNGKGSILEGRELVALFIDSDKWPEVAASLTVHSAHEAKTAHEGFERLYGLIDNSAWLRSKLRQKSAIRQSEGGEAIILRDGRRIRFRTRTSGGGRGLSGDLLVFDEAMILAEGMHRAVWPIVTARPNPQIWYTGSAVDQEQMEHGLVFAKVRNRGISGDPDLMYVEWSLDEPHPDAVMPDVAMDPEIWKAANPGLDIRLSRRVIAVEQRSLSARGFAVERLGVGDWPDPDNAGRVIDPAAWAACADADAQMRDPVCLAFDVTPDRATSSISAAGWDHEGHPVVEVIKHGRGTAWVGPTLAAIAAKNRPLAIVCDGRASGSLLSGLEEDYKLRIMQGTKMLPHGKVVPLTSTEHARGCGLFYDGVEQGILRHRAQRLLDLGVNGAVKRPLSDAWAWDKKNSSVDICPLVSATLALWGLYEYRSHSSSIVSMADVADDDDDEVFDEGGLPPLEDEDL